MVPRGVCGGILHFVHQQAIAGARLYNDDTMQQLLDKLDVIECFRDPGHGLLVGEMLEKPSHHFLS